MVRSMLNYSIVHLSLWMHALMTDAYMLNRVPKNPYELWMGRKPSLRHFHVWGCSTKVRVYNPHEEKLDARTISGFLIGYPEKSKGYRFYCHNHSTIIVKFGNARFIEIGQFSWSEKSWKINIVETYGESSSPKVPHQDVVPLVLL